MNYIKHLILLIIVIISITIYKQYSLHQLDTCYVSDTHQLTKDDDQYIKVLICSKSKYHEIRN